MGKKIVVLTGSPRRKGNSFAMTEAFIEEAKALGHEITRFDTAFMKIGGCRACDTCYSTGKACSFDDDFNAIAAAIEEADGVVFTMPVYWYTMPAQIKAAIDKFYSFMVGGRKKAFGDADPISGKACGLIACCGDEELDTFDGMKFAYEKTIGLLKWNSVGEVLIPAANDIGDIENTDGKAQAAALAAKF